MEQDTKLIESPLTERTNFWFRSVKLLNRRYPTQRSLNNATVDDLIDVCYEVHKATSK